MAYEPNVLHTTDTLNASNLGSVPTGIVKGATGSLVAATAGTDYLAPGGSGASLTGITESQVSGLTTDLAAKATDAFVVHLSAAETITGVKTFSNLPVLGTLTGLVMGASGVLTVATAGTDYVTPTGSGSGLTGLNASNITSGTVAAARLGSGTPSSSNFLRGDGAWTVIPAGAVVGGTIQAKSADYTMVPLDAGVAANAATTAFIVTLPDATAVTPGVGYTVKKIDSVVAHTVTVATQASQTIDGASTVGIAIQWKALTFVSNGTNWYIF